MLCTIAFDTVILNEQHNTTVSISEKFYSKVKTVKFLLCLIKYHAMKV